MKTTLSKKAKNALAVSLILVLALALAIPAFGAQTETSAVADTAAGDSEKKPQPTLLETVRDNAAYVASFAGIIAAAFLVAAGFEHIARKKNGEKPVSRARRAAAIGVFSALSFVLFLAEFPLPFLAPPFYKLDFSEIPALVGAYAFGPVAGVLIEFIKIALKLAVKGTTTAFVGDLANFVVGCSFILPASIIYHFNKSKKGAWISGAVGSLSITLFGSLFNALYLLPAFSALYHMPLDAIVAMGGEIIPAIKDVPTFALFAVAPFNLIKGPSVTLFTILVYKKISPILKYGVRKGR